MEKLTTKQEHFARLVALEDYNFSDAYRHAYDTQTASDKTIHEHASRLVNQSKVGARVHTLRLHRLEHDDTYQILVKAYLVDTLEDETIPTKSRLRASELLGRATGLFTQKIDVTQRTEYHNPLKELTIEELKKLLEEVKKREAIDGEVVREESTSLGQLSTN